MKNFFVLTLLLCSMAGYSQKIDGFYKGVLNNDSANKMVQEYELAIAMYKGKITGYSYVTFIVKDTFYYGIRKVKGEIVGDSIVVTDDKFVSNNFPENPAKGVKRTITIPLNGRDSITNLSGTWKTNQTKRYYSVPGTIELAKSADSTSSPLINHLKELGIVSTENYMVTAAETKTNKTETIQPAVVAINDVATNNTKKKDKTDKAQSKRSDAVKNNTSIGNEVAKTESQPIRQAETTTTSQQTNSVTGSKPVHQAQTAKLDTKPKNQPVSTITATKEPAVQVSNTNNTQLVVTGVAETKSTATKTAAIQTTAKTELPKTITTPEKASYQQRSMVVTKTVEVNADSLVLAFYDNGVVDGDSISVYLDGELIVPSTKLKTVATKATIHVAGKDEVKIVLVADNMGTIPPNTGLMSIRDGDNIYQVHFSADMQTNASIIIRRKKN